MKTNQKTAKALNLLKGLLSGLGWIVFAIVIIVGFSWLAFMHFNWIIVAIKIVVFSIAGFFWLIIIVGSAHGDGPGIF